MREIKFRGKRLDNGEWIEGDLLRMNGHWFIFLDPAPEGIDKYAVDPATVGEFTGLKDKNGKEIYEGGGGGMLWKYPKLISTQR